MSETYLHQMFHYDYNRLKNVLNDKANDFEGRLRAIPNTYFSPLCAILEPAGFDRKYGRMLGGFRAHLARQGEADTILRIALHNTAPANFTGTRTFSLNYTREQLEKAAVLKLLRHTYLQKVSGGTEIWIVSTPKSYTRHVAEEIVDGSRDFIAVNDRLSDTDEQFSAEQRKHLANSTQDAKRWIKQTLIALSRDSNDESSTTFNHVRKWFSGFNADARKVRSDIRRIKQDLVKVENIINSNRLIFTDMPHLRYSTDPAEVKSFNSIAFVFRNMLEHIPIIYIENSFFNHRNRGMFNVTVEWANTVIHEVTHLILNTSDHRYRHQGLSPNTHLTPAQALLNADNWGLFCAAVSGVITDFEIDSALYGRGAAVPEMPPVVPEKIRKPPMPPPRIRTKS